MNQKKSKMPKVTMIALLTVSAVLLILLCVWLISELKDTFADDPAHTTAVTSGVSVASGSRTDPVNPTGPSDTSRSDTGKPAGNEVVMLVESYIEEMRGGMPITLSADGVSVALDLTDAGAPVDYTALEAYMKSKGYDTSLIGQYQMILETQGVSDTALNHEYIVRKVDELANAIDTGSDTTYELGESSVTFYRGAEHTSIDKQNTVIAVKKALKEFDYAPIIVETSKTAPEVPDLNDLRSIIYFAPQDAYYDPDGVIVPEVVGYDIDVEAIRQELETGTWVEKTFEKITVQPEITVETIDQHNFKDLLGRGVTYYNTYEINRTENVRLATEAVNGAIIMPGKNFSFNDIVGERTGDKGYKPATVFANGGMQEGLGGGICQVASTIYVASLYAEMDQIARATHAYKVSYVDLGMDATIYWGSLDYIFRNNTPDPIKVVATANNGTLTISIYGTETRDANRTIKFRTVVLDTYEQEMIYKLDETMEPGTEKKERSGYPGYKVELYKQIYVNGVYQNEVKVNTSKYSPYNGLTYHGPEVVTEPTTEPPATEPSTPPTTEPTAPPATEPTAPPTTEPTAPPTTEPTAPPTTEPMAPPTTEPTEPPTTEPTEPPASGDPMTGSEFVPLG